MLLQSKMERLPLPSPPPRPSPFPNPNPNPDPTLNRTTPFHPPSHPHSQLVGTIGPHGRWGHPTPLPLSNPDGVDDWTVRTVGRPGRPNGGGAGECGRGWVGEGRFDHPIGGDGLTFRTVGCKWTVLRWGRPGHPDGGDEWASERGHDRILRTVCTDGPSDGGDGRTPHGGTLGPSDGGRPDRPTGGGRLDRPNGGDDSTFRTVRGGDRTVHTV